MSRNKLTSAILCTAMLLCLAACSQPEPEPVQSDMTSGTAAAETSSERIHSETSDSSLSEPVQTAENNSTVSTGSSSEANASVSSSTSTVPSKPKPPTVSSAPPNPQSSSSAPPAAESSAPQEPDEPEPEPPEERDPYAYPFDIEAIKQDLIKYGESLGMKHHTVIEERYYDATEGKWVEAGTPITPENSSWAIPSVISREWKADKVKKELFEYLEYDFNKYHMTSFTIYTEPLADGAWRIYVLR